MYVKQGVSARSLLSHSLIWITIEPNHVEEFRPDFAQWQSSIKYV
jgi:hypothetical protein